MKILQPAVYAASDFKELLENLQGGIEDSTDAGGFVQGIIDFALPLSAISAFMILAFSSYKLMMSKGDPEKLKDARDQITNAIIGFIFVLVSVGILYFINHLLGLSYVTTN